MLIMQGGTYLAHRTVGDIQARTIRYTGIVSVLMVVLFVIAGFFVANMDGYVITSSIDKSALIDPISKSVTLELGAWLNNYHEQPILWAFLH